MLGLVATAAAGKNWRDMKRSPYFFQRLQAGKRLQTYMSASFALFLVTFAVGLYSWQTPKDETVRMAVISYSKPVPGEDDSSSIVELPPTFEGVDALSLEESESSEPGLQSSPASLITVAEQPSSQSAFELPEVYDRLEPQAELSDNSNLSPLNFSTEVTDEYDAVDPRQIFAEGFYTLYATFDYEGLEDGMVWSWVWRHEGDVVEGGNEVWAYGADGPGYIFFNPEEGFDAGQYSLDIWVNGELMAQSSVVMNNASLSANN